jgi:hypothetical protein
MTGPIPSLLMVVVAKAVPPVRWMIIRKRTIFHSEKQDAQG